MWILLCEISLLSFEADCGYPDENRAIWLHMFNSQHCFFLFLNFVFSPRTVGAAAEAEALAEFLEQLGYMFIGRPG